jgi:hypothetical protein
MYNYLQIYYVQGLMQEEYLKFLFLDILRKARLVVATNVYSLWCRAKSCMLSSVPTLTHILPPMFPPPLPNTPTYQQGQCHLLPPPSTYCRTNVYYNLGMFVYLPYPYYLKEKKGQSRKKSKQA